MKQQLSAKYLKSIHTDEDKADSLLYTRMCLEKGILLEPFSPITKDTAEALVELYGVDLKNANATFYKTFAERESLTLTEVFFDRILHYLTSYYELGIEAYIPNRNEQEVAEIIKSQLTRIKVLTKDELKMEFQKFIEQPLALPTEDVPMLADVVMEEQLQTDSILNKELIIELASEHGIIPKEPNLLVRVLVKELTGSTEYVKNQKLFEEINSTVKSKLNDSEFKNKFASLVRDYISTHGLQPLAGHFRVNKTFWLLIKKIGLQKEVNSMKRLSEKSRIDHTFRTILEEKELPDLEKATVLQLIKWYNYLKERMISTNGGLNFYRVRNGKVYIKEERLLSPGEASVRIRNCYEKLLLIRAELNKRFSDKKLKFYQPDKRVDIKMPTSAKSFIGNYPLYSSIEVGDEYQVGIYWSEEGDLDLHAHTMEGQRVGFYAEEDDDIVYTGDMIQLNEQGLAAEAMISHGKTGVIYSMHPYAKKDTTSAKIYIADSLEREATRVVEDGQVIFQASVSTDKAISFATSTEGKIVLSNFSSGGRTPNETTSFQLIDLIKRKEEISMSLTQFASIIGAEFVENKEEATHDFSQQSISVSTFTDLLKTN